MNAFSGVGQAIRQAGPVDLAQALRASRSDTLAAFARIDGAATVPLRDEFNPPLWELGHIGWFQSVWLARNPERHRGAAADPQAPRLRGLPGVRADADALYDSSRVAHDTRWSLPLPDARTTQAELAAQLEATLTLLRAAEAADAGDAALYFFRLALLHEDMHHEASLTMAQALGLPVADARWQPVPASGAREALAFEAGPWRLGYESNGFAFDNELGAHEVLLSAYAIDNQVLRWADYLPFVEAGGRDAPRHLRRHGGRWQCCRWGQWQPLDLREPACHLSQHDALAWCAWAGRRLPTEAEWERAAIERPEAFDWGAVWEWTSSPFSPYPGFTAHPYRDYSAPWFGSRVVLRGASFGTQPRLHHPRYRNFFAPERTDIFAGFRSCAR